MRQNKSGKLEERVTLPLPSTLNKIIGTVEEKIGSLVGSDTIIKAGARRKQE
jgi:hypothetical protein